MIIYHSNNKDICKKLKKGDYKKWEKLKQQKKRY